MEWIERVYDVKTLRFKSLIIPAFMFTAITTIAFVIGLFLGMPSLLFPSVITLAIAVITLFHDHWVLNSIVIPSSFIFSIIAVLDVLHLNVFLAIVHVPVALIAAAVTLRSRASFSVMMMASIYYSIWMYTVQRWVPASAYGCILWVCDPFWQAIIILSGCGIVSILATVKNVVARRLLGTEITCDGPCPL